MQFAIVTLRVYPRSLDGMQRYSSNPYFHAVYGEHRVAVEVDSGAVHGTFPPRALRHVREWAALHHTELLANWQRAKERKPLHRIAPLE